MITRHLPCEEIHSLRTQFRRQSKRDFRRLFATDSCPRQLFRRLWWSTSNILCTLRKHVINSTYQLTRQIEFEYINLSLKKRIGPVFFHNFEI